MASSKGIGSGALMVLFVVLVSVGENGVMGQQLPDCVGKILPCASFLNSTSPPESCCSPLREAFQKEISCLCGLFNSRESFKPLGLNLTQILQLPKRCGINYNLDVCNSPAPAPSTLALDGELGPATSPSPAFALPPVSGSGDNMAKVGMASLMSILLLASMIV